MRKKFIKLFSWIFGSVALVAGISRLLKNPLESLYLLSLAAILLPPVNQLILKTKYAKQIKVALGVLFFASLLLVAFKPAPDPEGDKIKTANMSILKIISKEYCEEKNKCADSLSELFEAGYTGPFESFKHEDYTYRSIDNGKDCVISTTLSTGEQKPRLCIGDNLEYVKYLRNPQLQE